MRRGFSFGRISRVGILWFHVGLVLAVAPVGGFAFESLGPEFYPLELERRTERMMNPRRDEERKPDQVVAALGLAPGQVVADIGSGPGYFALHFARAVTPGGRVYGVDIEPRFVDELRKRAADSGLTNVVPVLTTPGTSGLPAASCDLAFFFSVYSHIKDRVGYLRELQTKLRSGGRVAIIEYKKIATLDEDKRSRTRIGPPEDKKIDPEQVVRELNEAGFVVLDSPKFLTYHFFLVAGTRD
ncbi:MAG: methyltransferase domain-containing protein [Deferrisomatales bacterium]|nr:methyltransferase domain-containing protein [Deferrisomatales bacterium]